MNAAAKTPRSDRRRALQQSLTLLRLFLVASAGILAAGALTLGLVLAHTMRSQALAAERTSLTQYVDGVIRPQVVRHDRVVPSQVSVHAQPDVVSIKVWRADGTLAWANRGRNRIGKRFPLEDELGDTMKENKTVSDVIATGSGGEHALEASLGFSHLFEVYAPLKSNDGSRAIGAYEIYADPAGVDTLIGSRVRLIWLTVGGVFLALYAALLLLVRGASRTLRRQTEELRERAARLLDSYRRLEESSLEAVESLNATVDAKDPYTAGHSQRVERIAVAIGEQLGLDAGRLDALHFAGLFHDIGKIAVPDSILTKPASLTAEEFEVIKRHPADGAAIVERLARLRVAVPLIRHHHERWDGAGYPDGLAGESIPFEAAIVGLADAWDAMITDRPYCCARTVAEAATEIRNGRGTQFAPAVVDGFFDALRRRPSEFGAHDDGSSVRLAAS